MQKTLYPKPNIQALVPVKPFSKGKSRIAPLLDLNHRTILARHLLLHTLSVLKDISALGFISGYNVVSADQEALRMGRFYGATSFEESSDGQEIGLNAALELAARQIVTTTRCDALLILLADLPLMNIGVLRDFLFLETTPFVAIAPDRLHKGTNALLLAPSTLLDFSYNFGENSFALHLRKFHSCGLKNIRRCYIPELAYDLDTPEDFVLLPQKWQSISVL
ncbi:2-phospho-L-lactate guanylyltransferase [Candidatus Chlorohelix sp.]|uniref:2-phospho-L-lactate guanylyltransferase n=1 Tax=Candidatus Chlorohelix sp. TaxID=3139201 RepID=UPI003024E828